jgi:Xaa-Pro dipeptidase
LKQAKGIEIINKRDYGNSLLKVLRSKLKDIKKIGVNEMIFPYMLYKKFSSRKYVDVSEIAYNLRSIKEPKEIGALKKAAQITNYGLKVLKEKLSRKMTEKEICFMLEEEMIRKGADSFSFPPIIKSGESSAYIHPYPGISDDKIKNGLGLIDFGIYYNGYCSDMTVPLKIGKLNPKELLIAKTVEESYKKSIDSLKIGKPTWEIFDISKEVIEREGFDLKHSLGHGIGLDVHEYPNLSPKPTDKASLKKWKEEKLKENMVFTIEPGIYVPGVGGYRIENDILLTKRGPEFLTKAKPLVVK